MKNKRLLCFILLGFVLVIITQAYIGYRVEKNWQDQICKAVDSGNFRNLNELLSEGAKRKFSVDFLSDKGYPPLTENLFATGCSKMILSLLKYGADPNFKDKYGDSPLYKSAELSYYYKDHDIPFLFIKYGADLKKSAYFDKEENLLFPVLHSAVIHGKDLKLIEYLLQQGENPNFSWSIQRDRWTLLCWSCYMRNFDVIRLLLKYGADPNKPDEEWSQLHLYYIMSSQETTLRQKTDLLELFFEHGAKVKLIPVLKNGDNILKYASKSCSKEIVDLLERNLETKPPAQMIKK